MTDEKVKEFIHRISQGNLKENGLAIRNDKLPYINLPLYKYCSVCEKSKRTKETREYNIENFENEVLYFQDPSQFNDPFDCFLGFSQTQIVKDLLIRELKKKHQYTQANRELINSMFDHPDNLDVLNDENYDCVIEIIEQTFKVIESTDQLEKYGQNMILNIAKSNRELFRRIVKNKTTIRDKQQLIDMMMDDPIYQEIFKKNLKSDNPDAILEITRREMKMKIEMNSNEMLFENEGETFSVVALILNSLSSFNNNSQSAEELDSIKMQFDKLSNDALYKVRQMVSEQFRVTCLSERMDSSLMWSHYANKHLGFCLEYDFTASMINGRDDLLLAQLMLFPVKYTNERPLLSKALFDSKNMLEYFKSKKLPLNVIEKIMYGLLSKSEDWNYEKEWRIFQLGKKDTMKLPKPRKIFLGANMENETKERLIEIAEAKKIPVFQMRLTSDQYKFDYYQIK